MIGSGTTGVVISDGTNLLVEEGAEPIMQSNDICPDPPVATED